MAFLSNLRRERNISLSQLAGTFDPPKNDQNVSADLNPDNDRALSYKAACAYADALDGLCCTNWLKGGLPLSPDGLILRAL